MGEGARRWGETGEVVPSCAEPKRAKPSPAQCEQHHAAVPHAALRAGAAMGCGGSRADAIEPRYYESWTRETESTWLTYTDSDSPPQEPGGAEAGGREQGAGRSGERGRAGGEGSPRAGMGLGGAGHCARDEGGIGNEEL